jgi:hypothetical protein
LLDVLAANDGYFDTVVAYVQGRSELDAARYVLSRVSTNGTDLRL